MASAGRLGRVVRQRPAKPRTAVRIRQAPFEPREVRLRLRRSHDDFARDGNEWLGLIDVTGLELESLHGGVAGEPFTDESSEYVFVVRR